MSRPKRILSRRVELELQQYPGKWVALNKNRLLAVGDSAKEVYDAAQAQGVEVPLLMRVPRPDERFYFVGAA